MIIAIDFDGTCVTRAFPDVGRDVPGAVDSLHRLVADGHQLILWTSRSENALKAAVRWFKDRGIPLLGVGRNPVADVQWAGYGQSPKVYADLYIDDAAVGCPLTQLPGEKHPVVWWASLMQILQQRMETCAVNGYVTPGVAP